MHNLSAITFDVDWAPDWAIAECRDYCAGANVRATFFATHESPILRELSADFRFEIGIHPNFHDDSTHGRTPVEVLDHCSRLVPAARAMRTHDLMQSSRLFALIADDYGQIETDSSLFLFGHDDLRPVDVYSGNSLRRLTRLPFYWADDVFARTPGCDWADPVLPSRGLRIFTFHPILISLNVADPGAYAALKSKLGERSLKDVMRQEVEPLINQGIGVRSYLERVVDVVGRDSLLTVSEITEQYREACSEAS
jgi:hypothetical protein